MVAGLKFLSKKGFNPQNLSNQKRVWEREQLAATEERRLKERADQLRRERDDEELARARGDQVKLGFMYQAPPGLESNNNNDKKQAAVKQEASEIPNAAKSNVAAAPSSHDVSLRQPGDDDAAAAFRAMLAGTSSSTTSSPFQQDGNDNQVHDGRTSGIIRGTAPGAFGTVLQGSSYDKMAARSGDEKQPSVDPSNLSNLEKAVGRRQQGSALTLEEQIERFPALANAPRQRGVQVGVSFKPLGTQIRNVRCMKCGVWGHSKGDRECKMSGWDPFSAAAVPTAAAAIDKEEDSKPRAGDQGQERRSRRKRSSRDYHSGDDDKKGHDDSFGDSDDSDRRRKRRRKHAKRSSYASDSDDEDSSRRRRKKHRSKKKKKKHRRKHERDESSSRRHGHRLDSSDDKSR